MEKIVKESKEKLEERKGCRALESKVRRKIKRGSWGKGYVEKVQKKRIQEEKKRKVKKRVPGGRKLV